MFLPLTIHCQTSPRFCYHILTQIIVEYGLSGHFDASLECNQVSFNAPLLKSSIETVPFRKWTTIQEMERSIGACGWNRQAIALRSRIQTKLSDISPSMWMNYTLNIALAR